MLSSRIVLTAAHCQHLYQFNSISDFKVALNVQNHDGTVGMVKFTPSAWINHENYEIKPAPSSYDFAIIKLLTHVDIFRFTPICLPSITKDYDSVVATVSGWDKLIPKKVLKFNNQQIYRVSPPKKDAS